MIRPALHSPQHKPARPPSPDAAATVYGAPFWLAYASNLVSMTAIAILYRYADFVTLLGGTEFHLGWIVGVGMVGSLAMRLAMGVGLDRHGPRTVWFGSILLFSATCLAHLAVNSHTGAAIYALRIAYCCSVAGIFGAAMTFVSGRAPLVRVAESISMIGTAGFLGMLLGAWVGDWLAAQGELQRWQADRMFLLAGGLGLGALPLAWLSTRRYVHPIQHGSAPALELLRRYHPGFLLAITVSLGMLLSLPGIFLRTFAADLGINRMGLFFTVYCATAIVTRVATRQWPQRLGLERMIVLGIAGLGVSQLLFLAVGGEWQLLLPGISYGISHAILFPAVVAASNRRFPEQHRGVGTVLSLAMWDVGQLVGAPAIGVILHCGDRLGLPSYPIMFLAMAGVAAVTGGAYLWTVRRSRIAGSARPVPSPRRLPAGNIEPTVAPSVGRE